MLLEPGAGETSLIDGYTSLLKIHEGAETLVYRARSAADGAPVILKVTKNEYPTSREVARLRREFAILRELDLPHTPKAYELREHGRGLALVMADIGKRTLREILDARRLDIGEALAAVISLSDVLAAVHQRRVIHKDVTPKNILVDEATGQAYLIDFGISARLSAEAQATTGLHALEGTLLYIAPEQTGRINRAVDLRADLYSLGVVLYEMLTGAAPFVSTEPMELIRGHLAQPVTPPRERAPSVPEPLSDIVMTLLAKTPEDRYQSDAGLRADLLECLQQWNAAKRVAAFPLRRRDKATELRRTQKLYGRERDIEALVQAFERARVRGPELCLVSGYSGVGKSALVNETQKVIARDGGYFISGKFDQISRDVPLAPVVQAFRDLILQIMTEPPDDLARWRAEILAALGSNGKVLTELVPELELVIGPQPPVPELSLDQARNRFELTLRSFLEVFASAAHPLVVFLDDLQWIDAASRKLVEQLLGDLGGEHMLFIGAYRDNEVEPGHPLLAMVDGLCKKGVRATTLHVSPLDRPTVSLLVADMLTSPVAEVEALAALVHEKTQGNPFFVHQFMLALNEQGLLHFDASMGAWRWDAERIRGAGVTDNVVELLVKKLEHLAPATRQALMLASCIGHCFSIRLHATIAGGTVAASAAALWEAMREGLVVPLDGDYRYLEAMPDGAGDESFEAAFDVRYKFLHDRILQAAYSLIAPERKQEVHLQIGRLHRRRDGGELRDEDLLDVVRHLNLGRAGITDPEERVDLARLNLRAGRKARAATAYDAALSYFRAGLELTCDADWEHHADLCFSLHVSAAECEHLCGEPARAEALFNAALPRTKTKWERAWIGELRVRIRTSLAQYAEALAVGSEGLALLGYPLTMDEMSSEAVFMAELSQIPANLGDRRIEDLIDAPELRDPELRAVLQILDAMGTPAYYANTVAFGVITARAMNFALKHGHTDVCAFAYSSCAYVLALLLDRIPEGLAYAKLALDLIEKFPNVMQAPRSNLCYGCCSYFQGTLRDAERYYITARQTGMESGDFANASVGCFLSTLIKLSAGDQLDDVMESADKNLAIVRRTRYLPGILTMTVIRQAVANLLGKTLDRGTLSDGEFIEEEAARLFDDPTYGNPAFHYYFIKAQLHCIYGNYEEAMAAADAAELRGMYAAGNPPHKELSFYRCLMLLSAPLTASSEEAARRAELLDRHKKQLDGLAHWSPKSYQHRKLLVDAETARVAGDVQRAILLYEEAIFLAREHKEPHIEAMANELCAKFYLSIGANKAAGAYMKDAYRAYLHWGAVQKADAIEVEFAQIWPWFRRESTREKTPTTTSQSGAGVTGSILGRTTLGSLRDAALILHAAQTFAGELDLTKVIERLARTMLDNAGAQRGALILVRDGQLVIEAIFGAGGESMEVGRGEPLDSSSELPRGVVRYVARTQESVILDDAGAASRFADDPYIVAGAPKSMFCLPLLHQGRLSGILYLESAAASGVFSAVRVELLTLLSSQAAVAIENARLLADVRAANNEVRRANERLEEEVANRTRELRAANARLEGELAERERVERERAALQEQIILAQRERLAELSTPLIPITDEIVVMPLIGTVDRDRAQQVLEVALQGAQRYQARFVILDITGIKAMDTGVARTLVAVADALRLLGTEAVLTGTSPQVATMLVGLGVEFTFLSMGTLQSAMEYALRRLGAANRLGWRR